MQVGELIERYEDVPSWLESHPHAKKERWVRNNAIYIAADKLSLNPELPGAGCVTFTEKHKLTKEGCSRSVWDLPEFFREIPITYNANAWKDDGFHSAAKGQEFVLTANRNILQWLQLIIT